MLIENIVLKDFRNYEYQEISPKKGINIIYGRNAQGKTNILESIFLCSTARSHRTNKDSDLIRTLQKGYLIKIEGKRDDEPFSIDINCTKITSKTNKRIIKVNDISLTRTGQLMGVLNSVMFSPEDLTIIKEGPSERRRFLDILISQINPSYFYALQEYFKILKQKNALLKNIYEGGKNKDLIEIYNQKQAKTGIKIIKERKNFIEQINIKAKQNHYDITKGIENLEIKYECDIVDFSNEENELYKALEKITEKEIKIQSSILGPHRDDIEIILDGMNIKDYGSQGQQRTAILSLKFAEMQIIKEKTGKKPVLLLDDALSELDLLRKRTLLDKIDTKQTFITCTEKRKYMTLDDNINFFYVNKGTVKSV
ncbi:MAG TPA: DNA replication/repair protein RecF [Clostridia bacterium]|jgi:DNA replication and repair protein RecF|nr:MAG: DNA replication and repair protein RecF [Firmicutes bacterium ADurb.Bin146]HOD92810.1 DNA replication/repair protein RecF [Clostridia bacterium]